MWVEDEKQGRGTVIQLEDMAEVVLAKKRKDTHSFFFCVALNPIRLLFFLSP